MRQKKFTRTSKIVKCPWCQRMVFGYKYGNQPELVIRNHRVPVGVTRGVCEGSFQRITEEGQELCQRN